MGQGTALAVIAVLPDDDSSWYVDRPPPDRKTLAALGRALAALKPEHSAERAAACECFCGDCMRLFGFSMDRYRRSPFATGAQ